MWVVEVSGLLHCCIYSSYGVDDTFCRLRFLDLLDLLQQKHCRRASTNKKENTHTATTSTIVVPFILGTLMVMGATKKVRRLADVAGRELSNLCQL